MEKTLKKPAKDFMAKKVIAVQENENIKALFKLLDQSAILGVPVVDDKHHVVGIVTETDLIRHFTTLETPHSINLLGSIVYLNDISDFNKHLKEHCAETVKDLMTAPAITANETATLLEVINLMSENNISRLPVVNKKGELTGIITRKDVVHQLAKVKHV
ncbi:CBS domain-containing protein [Candidatus Peregrinibacteria bacterium]|nr:CBS domain-containing protein [Candidatus Peregrinibacteria bacterium]